MDDIKSMNSSRIRRCPTTAGSRRKYAIPIDNTNELQNRFENCCSSALS